MEMQKLYSADSSSWVFLSPFENWETHQELYLNRRLTHQKNVQKKNMTFLKRQLIIH